MDPLVSVLLATRDGLATLPKALGPFLDSPLDVEVVVVDDGSRDGTGAWLAGLRSDRLRVLRLEEPVGLPAALNRAAAVARGAYFARQDADDVSHPGRLERQLERFRARPSLDILGTGHRVVDEEGKLLGEIPGKNFGNLAKRLAIGNVFCHGSLMFRAESFCRLGGYREFFRFSQDYDLVLRACRLGMRLENLPDCLYDWTFSSRSISVAKAREQRLYTETARRLAGDATRDPEACFRGLMAQIRESGGRSIPPERALAEILLKAGDTAAARRLLDAPPTRGAPLPGHWRLRLLSSLPSWLYLRMRSLADLRYR